MAVMTSRWQLAQGIEVESVALELEAFIRARFEVSADDPAFHHDTLLWQEGYVDSTGAVEVIAFLEERYQLTLPDDLLYDPEFTTIAGIARCVGMLLGR